MLKWNVLAALVFVIAVAGVSPAAAQGNLTADDYAEINQLYARYNFTIDSGDAKGYAETFTSDGVFLNFEGREAIAEFAKGFYQSQKGAARHWNTNLSITQTSEGADGACYLLLWNTSSNPPTIITSAIYRDKLVKTSDGWRFKSRRTEADRPPSGE